MPTKKNINLDIKSCNIQMNYLKKYLPQNTNFLALTNNKTPVSSFKGKDPKIHNIMSQNSANYGVRCEDIVCVDCDLDKDGQDIDNKFKVTLSQKTGGGGYHYIYLVDERMSHWKMRSNLGPKKYDIKIGKNSYFVGAGSTSKKGKYTIFNKTKVVRMPDKLFNEINSYYTEKGKPDTSDKKKPIPTNTTEKPTVKKSIMEINEIISKCPPVYFADYDTWKMIGWAMHYENHWDETKQLFIKRSREAPGYNEVPDSVFDHFWENSNKTNSKQYTLGSVIDKLQKDGLLEKKKPKDKKFNINTFYSIKLEHTKEDELYDLLSIKAKKEKDKKDELALYKKRKEYFEQFHIKVMSPFAYCSINENDVDWLKKNEFRDRCDNILVKDKAFTTYWFKDPSIRSFYGLDFAPRGAKLKDGCFNLYRGLEIEKYQEAVGDSKIFLNHMKILVGNDDKCFNYLLNYLAQLVQFPGIKPNTALVFVSDEGVGKNVFFENFAKKILGHMYLLQTADQEKIFGKFNISSKRLMILVDEVSGKDSYLNSEIIKNNITCVEKPVEKKGVQPIVVQDFARYFFFSNNQVPVKISLNDRRFVVFNCSSEVRNNTTYFKKLINSFNNKKIVRGFYNYLMDIDLKDFDPVNDRPITEIYKELKKVNVPIIAKFLEHRFYTSQKEYISIQARDFYKEFQYFYFDLGYKKDLLMTYCKFGRLIKHYAGVSKKRTNKAVFYTIDIIELNKYLLDKGFIEEC